jgi:hypothetical protein
MESARRGGSSRRGAALPAGLAKRGGVSPAESASRRLEGRLPP